MHQKDFQDLSSASLVGCDENDVQIRIRKTKTKSVKRSAPRGNLSETFCFKTGVWKLCFHLVFDELIREESCTTICRFARSA